MKSKKAISHVEVILSFIIFVGFLIFLIAIFNPFKAKDNNNVYLGILERSISDATEIKVDYTAINLNNASGSCFFFEHEFKNVSAKNQQNEIIPALSANNKIYINSAGKFFSIYSSSEFEEEDFNTAGCYEVEETDYSLGLYRSYYFVSSKSLNMLKTRYESQDYEQLKKDLGLSKSEDFSFSVKDTSGQYILNAVKSTASNAKVSAKEIPIQIIYSNGEIKLATLVIKIW